MAVGASAMLGLANPFGVEVEPDTVGAYRESGDFPVPVGKAHFIARGGIETAVNTGSETYREILVELKDANEGER